MWIFSKPLEELAQPDLEALLGVRESQVLEFKEAMYNRKDPNARAEMLRDVSSIANAEGGVLIIGMAEDGEGKATKIVPIPDAEAEANRLTSTCLTGIQERVPGLRTHLVPLSAGHVVVVSIPRSYRKPHMVMAERNELWIRHDRQKSQMTIAELRAAIVSSEDLAVKMEHYIESRRTHIAPQAGSRILLAIIAAPLSLENGRLEVNSQPVKTLLSTVDQIIGRAFGITANRAGVPTLEGRMIDLKFMTLEVFRTGALELIMRDPSRITWAKGSMQAHFANGEQLVAGSSVVELVFRVLDLARRLAAIAFISDPHACTVDLWNCTNYAIEASAPRTYPTLFAGPVLVGPNENLDVGVRRIADLLWNGFGLEACPYFDDAGRLKLPA